MASQNCGLPPCRNSETSSDSAVKLSSSECEVINYRFGINLEYLCSKHHRDQFSRYEMWHNKKCADPCLRHSKPCKSRLGVIKLETARSVNTHTEYRVIPGQSLCGKCNQYLSEIVKETEDEEEQRGSENENHPMAEDSG